MGLLDVKRRSRVAGLPIGPKHTDWAKLARLGAGAVAAVGMSGAAKKLKGKASDVADHGRNAMDSATDVADTVGEARDGAAGKSTGIGSVLGAFKSMGGDGGSDDQNGGGNGNLKKQRLIIQEQVDVAVPKRVAYNQWTQFEDFSPIFRAVQRVDQEEDDVTEWQAKMLVSTRHWKAHITEQVADERIAWESEGDVQHRGVVTFHEIDRNLTRVQVEMEYEPTGFVEKFGNLFLTVRHRVRKDLRLFKHFLELRGEETGAWRGEIEGDEPEDVQDGDASQERDEANREDEPKAEDERQQDEEPDEARAEADEADEARAEDDEQDRDENGRFTPKETSKGGDRRERAESRAR